MIFRSESVGQAIQIGSDIFFTFNGFSERALTDGLRFLQIIWLLGVVMVVEKLRNDVTAVLKWHPLARGLLYTLVFYYLILFGEFNGAEYIYFQF